MLVSYAQNFEDVILWRALGNVQSGFYIDIGAQDPVIDSVSLAFYEKGWRGVHIEPIPSYAERLRAARPDEEVIEAAIASTRGQTTIHEFADTGLSTGRGEIAERHEVGGFTSKPIEVETLRLSEVFDKYAGKEIHWLKIDVEGMEPEVIASWEPSPARPWILVIESTVPLSQELDYSEWEPNILAMGYEFVYFDGLNRFYLHQAHAELRDSFGAGPNVFDDFALSGKSNAPFASHLREQVAGLENQLRANEEQWTGEIERLHGEIARKDAEANQLVAAHQAEIAQMESARETAAQESAQTISGLEARLAEREERLAEKTAALAKTEEQLAASDRRVAALLMSTGRLEAAVAERDAQLTEKTAALAKTEEQLTASDRRIAALLVSTEWLEAAIAERDAQLAEKTEALENATARMAELDRYVAAVHMSTSWRITAPLRAISRGVRAVVRWPRSAARNFLHHALLWLRRRPRALALVRRAAAFLPPLERHALTFARARSDALPQAEAGWMLEPATETLEAWQALLRIPAAAKG